MNKISTLALSAFLFLSVNEHLQAQAATFKLSDVNSYLNAYMEPFAHAMPVSLGGGWTHTAKVHSTLGFDITFSGSIVTIPETAATVPASKVSIPGFDITGEIPTVSASSDIAKPQLTKTLSAGGYSQDFVFEGFEGLGMSATAMPAFQFGIGLPKGTEIIGRFIPDVSKTFNSALAVSNGNDMSFMKTGMWGLGVKHDIKQWIPVLSKVPILQISGLFTYSRFYSGFSGGDFAITPDVLGVNSTLNDTEWNNQEFKLLASSFTGNILVGANIPVFQPYIGVGFNAGKFESGFYGTYPVITIDENNGSLNANTSEKDPLIIESSKASINFQAGARLKLGPIVFFGSATIQEYAMYTGGFAITIR